MIYLISGKDSFRSSLYFRKVVNFYKKKGVSFFEMDFLDKLDSSSSIKEVRDFLGTNTLFSPFKLVVLKNLFRGVTASQQKDLWQMLKDKNIAERRDIMVVIYEEDEIKNSSLEKWLERKAKGVKVFPLLYGRKLEYWTEEQEKKIGVRLEPAARTLLVASFPGNSGLIYHSLEKLALSASGKITRKYLEDNIFLPFSSNIFDLLDNISRKRTKQAYEVLKKELQKGTFPLLILKMIILEFRNLLKIKTSSAHSLFQVQRKIHLHPYVLRKTYPLAQKFDTSFLKKMYRRLLYYDQAVKRGVMEGEVALDLFFLDIFSSKC